MFKKYANIVGDEEDVTFLQESDWTPEEWNEITKLMGYDNE